MKAISINTARRVFDARQHGMQKSRDYLRNRSVEDLGKIYVKHNLIVPASALMTVQWHEVLYWEYWRDLRLLAGLDPHDD